MHISCRGRLSNERRLGTSRGSFWPLSRGLPPGIVRLLLWTAVETSRSYGKHSPPSHKEGRQGEFRWSGRKQQRLRISYHSAQLPFRPSTVPHISYQPARNRRFQLSISPHRSYQTKETCTQQLQVPNDNEMLSLLQWLINPRP